MNSKPMALRAKIYMCVKKRSREKKKKLRNRKQAECCWGAWNDMMRILPGDSAPSRPFSARTGSVSTELCSDGGSPKSVML